MKYTKKYKWGDDVCTIYITLTELFSEVDCICTL